MWSRCCQQTGRWPPAETPTDRTQPLVSRVVLGRLRMPDSQLEVRGHFRGMETRPLPARIRTPVSQGRATSRLASRQSRVTARGPSASAPTPARPTVSWARCCDAGPGTVQATPAPPAGPCWAGPEGLWGQSGLQQEEGSCLPGGPTSHRVLHPHSGVP